MYYVHCSSFFFSFYEKFKCIFPSVNYEVFFKDMYLQYTSNTGNSQYSNFSYAIKSAGLTGADYGHIRVESGEFLILCHKEVPPGYFYVGL